jgi:DNA-binding response OmpR family regulator
MPTQKARLLVVDDDNDLRTTLPIILSAIGYHVRSASDGFSALIAIRSEVPDILISDLNMPGMSGFELLAVVRQSFPSIAVIAMSSAFSGHAIPAGVAADMFYEKATGVRTLLNLVKTIDSSQAAGRYQARNQIGGAPVTLPSISSF